MRIPDFENNTLRVLLFELFMNDTIYTQLAGHGLQDDTQLGYMRLITDAMAAAGYDYITCNILGFGFPQYARTRAATQSMNGQRQQHPGICAGGKFSRHDPRGAGAGPLKKQQSAGFRQPVTD